MEHQKINFIASVEDNQQHEIHSIAKKMEEKGCQINNVLSLTGIITGSTTTCKSLEELKIEGVKHIEEDRTVRAL
jgi:DUF4097 and DUF4098 domain-containing protein YvlB